MTIANPVNAYTLNRETEYKIKNPADLPVYFYNLW